MKKIFSVSLLLLVFLSMNITIAQAQCAMCSATVENNISSGGRIGAGLNAGILYLASVPYLVFIVIAYLWYKNSKKRNVRKKLGDFRYTS